MRTVFARLVALGAMIAVVGCSGNSTTPLPVTGGLNGTGGSTGLTTGSTTGGTGTSTATSTCTGTLPFFCIGPEGYQYTVTIPSSLTVPAGATIITVQAGTVVPGGPANPAGTFLLSSGSVKLPGAPTAGTGSPTVIVTSPNLPLPGRSSATIGWVNATGATVTQTCNFLQNQIVCPSIATYTWPASGTALFSIWVS